MSKAKVLIDELIEKKAHGNSFQVMNIKMKLLFKGIDYDKISEEENESKEMLSKIYEIASNFNVKLSN